MLQMDVYMNVTHHLTNTILKVDLRQASETQAGLPPSSLSSFLRAKTGIQGGLLAEFDTQYTNPAFATPHDTLDGINSVGIASVAKLVAQALHSLASGSEATLEAGLPHTLPPFPSSHPSFPQDQPQKGTPLQMATFASNSLLP